MLDRGDLENFGKAEAWETLRSNRAMRDRALSVGPGTI
ncbi:hypothetical protein J2S59_002154 [Nocardioides massiliensis]|uniref:Uncharacterized protein n=1 Tax=Nocardioides massiliensis TaxID=1325935 RepID=A0ABT9NQL3_9ACTN|nr:hypothetical protein [Nocardioides massiliensis]